MPARPAVARALRGALSAGRRHAWLALAAGALLIGAGLVDFAPPPSVRVNDRAPPALVGDAPAQAFAPRLHNPQAVQIRATLRALARDPRGRGSQAPAPGRGQLLSQPVVTTILGMPARTEQLVRLEGGDLEVQIVLQATPRLGQKPRRGAAKVAAEIELEVTSLRHAWWRRAPTARTHLHARGTWAGWRTSPPQLTFRVDEHLFALDVELSRGTDDTPALAATAP